MEKHVQKTNGNLGIRPSISEPVNAHFQHSGPIPFRVIYHHRWNNEHLLDDKPAAHGIVRKI